MREHEMKCLIVVYSIILLSDFLKIWIHIRAKFFVWSYFTVRVCFLLKVCLCTFTLIWWLLECFFFFEFLCIRLLLYLFPPPFLSVFYKVIKGGGVGGDQPPEAVVSVCCCNPDWFQISVYQINHFKRWTCSSFLSFYLSLSFFFFSSSFFCFVNAFCSECQISDSVWSVS